MGFRIPYIALTYMDLQKAKHHGPVSQNREHRQYSPNRMDPMLPIFSYCRILGHYFGHLVGPGIPKAPCTDMVTTWALKGVAIS